jgi:hypothetical protein
MAIDINPCNCPNVMYEDDVIIKNVDISNKFATFFDTKVKGILEQGTTRIMEIKKQRS